MEEVLNLGISGDVTNVKSGYARNYLIPYKKCLYATKLNLKILQNKKNLSKDSVIDKIKYFKKIFKKISRLSPFVIKMNAKNNGKLFGSIKPKNISKMLLKILNVRISTKNIFLSQRVIKNLGLYKVKISLHKSLKVKFLINIISL